MDASRNELNDLRSQELALSGNLEQFRRDIDYISKTLADTQLQISQLKMKLMHMEEFESRLTNGVEELEAAMLNSDIVKLNALVARTITPTPFQDPEATLNSSDFQNAFAEDPFAGEDPFKEGSLTLLFVEL